MNRRFEVSASVVAAAVVCTGMGCSPSSAPPPQRVGSVVEWAPLPERPSVVLIAIDGVRWQDVFDGVDPELASRHGVPENERLPASALVPNITRLVREGAAIGAPRTGPPMEASGPNFVSLPGYSEMLSGRRDTGCHDNSCGRIGAATVADDVARENIGRAAIVTSWPSIGLAAAALEEDADMSVGRSGGFGRAAFEHDPIVRPALEAGEHAGPDPGDDDFRNDAQTAALALAVYEARHPAFLFVGLGETDEFAHREDYRSYLDALRRADQVVGRFAEVVLHPKDASRGATLLITTDHGRSSAFAPHGGDHPESARVWLVAAGSGIAARGPTSSPEVRHLANVAPTIRAILGLNQIPGTEVPLDELFTPTAPVDRRAASN